MMLIATLILVFELLTHYVEFPTHCVVIVILEFDFLSIVPHQMVNVSRSSTNSIRLGGWSCGGVHVVRRKDSYEVGTDYKSNQSYTRQNNFVEAPTLSLR